MPCGLFICQAIYNGPAAEPVSTYKFVKIIFSSLLFSKPMDLSFKLFLHCYAALGKILTDTSRRAVRLR